MSRREIIEDYGECIERVRKIVESEMGMRCVGSVGVMDNKNNKREKNEVGLMRL